MMKCTTQVKSILCVLAVPFSALASMVSMDIDADGTTADFSFVGRSSSCELLLGYGTSDGGTDSNAWEHVVKIADLSAGQTSLSGVELPSGCGTSWTVARAFLPCSLSARDYVQRGLVLQYDALENAGYGVHADAPSVWKDLISSNDLPLQAEDIVGADYVQISTNVHETAGNVIDSYKPLMYDVYTRLINGYPWSDNNKSLDFGNLIEVPNVGRIGFWGTYGTFLTVTPKSADGTTRGYRNIYNGGWSLGEAKNAGWRTLAVYMKPASTASETYPHYINGVAASRNGGVTGDWTASRPSELTLRISGNDQPRGTVNSFRSVRIYDRELTLEEVVYNRMVDVARYEGGVFTPAVSDLVYAPAALSVVKMTRSGIRPVTADISFGASSQSRRLYIAYGPKDAGESSTNDYVGCDYVCDIPAGATEATVDFPTDAADYLAERGGYCFLLEMPLTAKDYIQSGLVLQYDAKENGGSGLHVAGLASWKDLVSSNDLPLDSEDVVSTNYVQISTNVHKTAGNVVDSYTAMSFEAYTRLDSLSPSGHNNKDLYFGTLLAIPHIGEMGYWGTWGSYMTKSPQPNLATGWRRVWNGPWALGGVGQIGWRSWSVLLAMKQESTGGTCYVNGAAVSQNTGIFAQISWPAATELHLQVGGNTSSTNVTVNSFRSVRIYDRKLTEEEIVYNREVDLSRYEGGVSPVYEWSGFARVAKGLLIVIR